MIDIEIEKVVSFRDAASILPKRRRGKRPHVATLYRWAESGCRGIVLETVQIGGSRCTSVEALQRFFARLSGDPAEPPRPPARRREDVERELDREGL